MCLLGHGTVEDVLELSSRPADLWVLERLALGSSVQAQLRNEHEVCDSRDRAIEAIPGVAGHVTYAPCFRQVKHARRAGGRPESKHSIR